MDEIHDLLAREELRLVNDDAGVLFSSSS